MFALIAFESKKLLAQRKTLIGLLNVALINLLFTVGFYLRNQRSGHEAHPKAEGHLVGEFMNAYMYTQAILAPCVYLLFPLVLAILGAHMIAGELEVGNMRMMLFRPVSRGAVFVAKFVNLAAYGVGLLLILGVSSYLLACLTLPAEGLVLVPRRALYNLPEMQLIPPSMAPARILLSYLLAIPMLASVAAMALMFGLMLRHYTSAAILTSTVYFASYIIEQIPMLAAIHPFLPTRYWPFWKYALVMPEIPWPTVGLYALWTGAYTLAFLIVGIAVFNLKDV